MSIKTLFRQQLLIYGLVGTSFFVPVNIQVGSWFMRGQVLAANVLTPSLYKTSKKAKLNRILFSSIKGNKSRGKPKKIFLKKSTSRNRSISVQSIIDFFLVRNRRKGTSKGDCFNFEEEVRQSLYVWSDRPLLFWEGNAIRIELQSQDGKIIWHYDTANDNQNSILYDGYMPLERGQNYTYSVQYAGDLGGDYSVVLKIMSEEQYQKIRQEYYNSRQETQHNKQKIDPDYLDLKNIDELMKMRLERAYFFAENNLFMDAMQELLPMQEKFPEIQNLQCILSTPL